MKCNVQIQYINYRFIFTGYGYRVLAYVHEFTCVLKSHRCALHVIKYSSCDGAFVEISESEIGKRGDRIIRAWQEIPKVAVVRDVLK